MRIWSGLLVSQTVAFVVSVAEPWTAAVIAAVKFVRVYLIDGSAHSRARIPEW